MWFHKGNQEAAQQRQLLERLSEELKGLRKGNEEFSRWQQAANDAILRLEETVNGVSGHIKELDEHQGELKKQVRRQSDSFEDLLEEIQAQREQQDCFNKEKREFQQKEHAMLALVVCCREQMELLRQRIAGDSSMDEGRRRAWSQQFELMNQETARLMRPCGLEEVGTVGEAVDYEIHEVLSVTDTEDESKANLVAEVYSPGLLQAGHVVKKARVAAYKQKAKES